MCSWCVAANFSRSGMRAIVPSSFITSQITPAGVRPARRQRSTLPSVCPARTRTPPLRADPGGHAFGGLDADGERGAEGALVLAHHHAQAELADLLLGQREADQPARVLGHEVDGLRRDELRRQDEVALVLAVGVVDQDDHPAPPQLLERSLDASDVLFHGAPQVRNCIRRATCLPRMSVSTFTRAPASLSPQVVARNVSGMRKSAILPGPSSSLTV